MALTRRQLVKWGIGLGGVAAVGGIGRALLIPPAPSPEILPPQELAVRLVELLDAEERAAAVFDYEHPFRQFHNRGVDTGGAWSITLSRAARQVLVDLVHAGLSEGGRNRVLEQFYLDLPGIHATRVAILGDPRNPPYQVLVTGPHLNLRIGGRNREGVAFGGPQVYGDQRGDGKPGLPGSAYRNQLELGQRLVASLSPAERAAARHPKAPVQTAIEVQGAAGRFDGVALADLDRAKRDAARDMVAAILESYPEEDAAYAWTCLESNGGIEALHLADYAEDHQQSRNVGDGPSQIIRLEGPAAVFHYRGEPHLHAFVNVAMDGERPMSVGDVVAESPARLERDGVRALFETILRETTGADAAYYHPESVAGPLRAGTLRTGDLYNLESWREHVTVVEVTGESLRPALAQAFEDQGITPRTGSRYRVATTSYIAGNLADEVLGDVDAEPEGEMLRDVAIAYLSERGFPGAPKAG